MNNKNELTTEHELYISVGLKPHAAMKPDKFREIIDSLLFENIGYMQNWGTHTKAEYIGIIDEQHETIGSLQKEIERLQTILKDTTDVSDQLYKKLISVQEKNTVLEKSNENLRYIARQHNPHLRNDWG